MTCLSFLSLIDPSEYAFHVNATAAIFFIFAFLVVLYIVQRREATTGKAGKSLPGPKGLPYVGIPYKLHPKRGWLQFAEWSKTYGPIFKFKIMGEDVVVISSNKIANDLMIKRKAIYCSRPDFPAVPGANDNMRYLPLLSAGDDHKRARRFAAHSLAQVPQSLLVEVTTRNTKQYIQALLQNPSDAKHLTELFASAITAEISWGDASLDVARQNVEIAHALLWNLSPGATIVSKLPFLRKVWDVLPMALQPWKAGEIARAQRERNFWFAGREKADSLQGKRFTLMEPFNQRKDKGISDETEATFSVGMLTVIGSMLLATPVQTFLIAMCHYPEWQAKGAEEIDRVCPGRLPTPSDLKDLPVLRAIIRELFRWRPPVPTGAPHASVQDDVYEDYFIPKNSTVLASAWMLERDPELYPDGDEFRPERWLDPKWPTYKEPLTVHPNIKNHLGFGWSSRACIGQDYTETVNMIMIGSLLATCTVSKKRDEATGQEIEIDTQDYEPYTIFVRPYPWEMHAEARSSGREKCLIA